MNTRKIVTAAILAGSLTLGGAGMAFAQDAPSGSDTPAATVDPADRCARAEEVLARMHERQDKGQELLARLQTAHDEAVAAGDEVKAARIQHKIDRLQRALERLAHRIDRVEQAIAEHCTDPAA